MAQLVKGQVLSQGREFKPHVGLRAGRESLLWWEKGEKEYASLTYILRNTILVPRGGIFLSYGHSFSLALKWRLGHAPAILKFWLGNWRRGSRGDMN